MKVVVNRCHGGFGLSPKAIQRYLELNGKECYFATVSFSNDETVFKLCETDADREGLMVHTFTKNCIQPDGTVADTDMKEYYFYHGNIERIDPKLIQVVEELGNAANGRFSDLEIVVIPDGIDWEISNYDGMESVEERHRSW